MSAIDQVVSINISQQTAAVQQASFSIPAVFGPSNRFASVTPTGTTANGSNKITGVSSTTGVTPGCSISGTGIPAGSYVTSVSGTTVYISANATASGSVTLTVTDAIRAYTSTAGMLADGFQNTDPEYIRAAEFEEQEISPAEFFVGRYSASVAQVDTFQVTTKDDTHLYSFKLNGTTISYQAGGSDPEQTILNGLLTNIGVQFPSNPPVTGSVAGTGGSALLTLTSSTPGAAVAYTNIDTDLTHVNTVANNSVVTEIQQAQVQNDTWYGLCICSNSDADITEVATYIETQKKIFIGVSNDANIPTSSTSDIASVMKGQSLKRTALIFSIAAIAQGIEAGWMGGQLPQTPGSNNWAYKTVVGANPDSLSANQQQFLIGVPVSGIAGKNVNIYQTLGGVNVMQMGQMIGGQYIDITIGIDWLESTIQTNIFQALTTASKIPYTDKGTNVLMSAVQAAIDQGVTNGLIDGASDITITAPLVASVPITQRANRIAPTISFSCRLQGAMNAVIVNGTVTV